MNYKQYKTQAVLGFEIERRDGCWCFAGSSVKIPEGCELNRDNTPTIQMHDGKRSIQIHGDIYGSFILGVILNFENSIEMPSDIHKDALKLNHLFSAFCGQTSGLFLIVPEYLSR